MDTMTIYNLGSLVGFVSIISFLAKLHHDSRKGEKLLRQEIQDGRKESQESETRLTEKIHESETRLTEKIHESETRLTEKIHQSETKLTEKIHESESKVTEKIQESERQLSRDIREVSDQVAEHRGILKATGTHPL